jgi:NitT/TauT family transport system ATP-binding protein
MTVMTMDRGHDSAQTEVRSGRTVVRAGFIPLLDCAVLAVAAEEGFARSEGIELALSKEASWASIRDKVNLGHLACAHMLAGMPIASSLGIGHVRVPTIAPFALGLNGNAITVSSDLYRRMADKAGLTGNEGPAGTVAALKLVIEESKARGEGPPTFGMVFPFSCHNYELRYWLAAGGIDPDLDVRLVVIPPPLMVESLRAGHIHGFCVGEPWNSLAVDAGLGRIIATKAEIWRTSPEKVLGVQASWAEANPEVLAALIRALDKAAAWCDRVENRGALAELLSRECYTGVPQELLLRILSGQVRLGPDGAERSVPDFILFHRNAANFPWTSHALWIYSQMLRWGQAQPSAAAEAVVRRVYRTDIYRATLGPAGIPLPGANAKLEGSLGDPLHVGALSGSLLLGPDRFFDGRVFDPDDIAGYLAGFDIPKPSQSRRGDLSPTIC